MLFMGINEVEFPFGSVLTYKVVSDLERLGLPGNEDMDCIWGLTALFRLDFRSELGRVKLCRK